MTSAPAWRRLFDAVEQRVGEPLKAVTGSPDFQVALHELRRAHRTIAAPVDGVVSWGLHLAGLPSHADVRSLRRQLDAVQRELLALRREMAERARDGRS